MNVFESQRAISSYYETRKMQFLRDVLFVVSVFNFKHFSTAIRSQIYTIYFDIYSSNTLQSAFAKYLLTSAKFYQYNYDNRVSLQR